MTCEQRSAVCSASWQCPDRTWIRGSDTKVAMTSSTSANSSMAARSSTTCSRASVTLSESSARIARIRISRQLC
ncbi:hypothetical protein BIV25_21680 [Streptomyces sp. MUSC 14]|nr:hypothetical protein BIV25_21680 [Streptomyces sp. MUSC 14]